MIGAVLVTLICGALAAQSPQQPPRDPRLRSAVSSNGSISGTVTSDDSEPRKLRRVRVTINGAALDAVGRTVITDDEGRYRITGLPEGQYGLTAAKDGYVPARYGSRRPARAFNLRALAMTGIALKSGETVTADLRLARGAVITGVVTDGEGAPEEGVFVGAWSYQYVPGSGDRRLATASPRQATTDDRGAYRLYDLPAGAYVVVARRPGSGAEPPLMVSSSSSRRVQAAPVYFPSTTDPNAATELRLAAGDERAGVDIQMRYVPTAIIAGIASIPPGLMAGRVWLTRATGQSGAIEVVSGTTTPPDGTFSLPNVVPGHYLLYAVAEGSGAAAGGLPNISSAAGSIAIDVDGDDLTNVAIPTAPTFSLSGTIVFEGAGPPDVRLGRMTLPIAPTAGSVMPRAFFQPVDESHFTIAGLIPGTYRALGTAVPGIRASIGKWWLKSIAIGGREVLDGPVEIRQSNDDVVIAVGDQASAVSGTLRDAHGAPLADTYVVIFSADRALWFVNSRRIAGVRTNAQGHYTIRNLPPGEYRAAVALDLDQGEWFDPDVLQGLQPTAVPLTIAGVEAKTLDLVLR